MLSAAVLLLAAVPAPPPTLTLGPHPARAVAGTPWSAPLRVTPAGAGRPQVQATTPGHQAVTAALSGGAGRYRLRVTFPAAGSWQVSARLAGRRVTLARVAVRPAPPPALQGAASLAAPCQSRAIPFPQDALVPVDGGFWLACRERGALVRLDGSGRPAATVSLPGVRPWALAAADDALWVVDRDRAELLRLDPASGAVQKRIELPAPATYVYAGAGAAWVALDALSAVVRVDPQTNTAGAPITVGSGPSGFASDGRTVWIACHRDASLWAVENGKARQVAANLAGGEAAPERAAFAGGSLWLTGRGVDLVRLDPDSGRVRQTIEIGPAGIDVIAAGDTVWVAAATPLGARRGDPLVARLVAVDTQSGSIRASRAATNGLAVTGRAVLGGELWLADAIHGLLLHLPA
jgi:hypothetical protein